MNEILFQIREWLHKRKHKRYIRKLFREKCAEELLSENPFRRTITMVSSDMGYATYLNNMWNKRLDDCVDMQIKKASKEKVSNNEYDN